MNDFGISNECFDFESCMLRWRNSPRIRGPMADAFRSFVTGQRRPLSSPLMEGAASFRQDAELSRFRAGYLRHAGTFKHHFTSSIPYVFQQDCSLGAALTAYLLQVSNERQGRSVSLWTIGNSEGVISRTVAHFGEGRIHTLNNNETVENEIDFNREKPNTAHFLAGTFCEVSRESLRRLRPALPDKFTIIHENLSFQMIQSNRLAQIAYIAQFLEEDGVFTALEKCVIPENPSEYAKREAVKDTFKQRYFTPEEMDYKRDALLRYMEQGQVSLATLVKAMARFYPHVAIIWNSCNFYTLVSSRSPESVKRFCSLFCPPHVPEPYVFLDLNGPLRAAGLAGMELAFRPLDVP